MQSTPERKPCGTCGNEYTVTANGTIRHHTTNKSEWQADPTPHTSNKCKGAGEPPATAAGVALAEDMESGGNQCRLCKHPVELTSNGRARSHMTPEATPRPCPGGSDFPLGTYPDSIGTTDGRVATLAVDCEHVPVGQCYGCADVPLPGGSDAAPWGVTPESVQQPTMADQFKATPLTEALARETSGVGTVLDAMDGDTRAEAERFMDAMVPAQPSERSTDTGLPATRTDRPGGFDPRCEKCDTDNHRCPGCGTDVRHGVVACGGCERELLARKLPAGWTEDGRRCEHHEAVFGVEDDRLVCAACGTPCTHPNGFTENDPVEDDGERLVFRCALCGAVDSGGDETAGPDPALPNCTHPETHRAECGCPDDDSASREPIDGWRTPLDILEKMPDEVRGLDALRLNCRDCGHPVTPLVDHFGMDGKAKAVTWACEPRVMSMGPKGPCRDHECTPNTSIRLGDLDEGDYFVRRGTLMRLTERESSTSAMAVVLGGPYDGREGELKNLDEKVDRAPEPRTTEQETTECTNDRMPQQRPASSATSSTRTTTPTAPAPGSRQPTGASAPTVLPDSLPVTSSAPTARAAGNGRSAAMTTDQSAAAAAFLGSGRPAAPATVNRPNQADAAAQFLAGGSGAHGEKETDRDRWGRYLILHPDTGKEKAWTRATTFAKSISDTYALSQWGLRMALLGATQRPDIVQRAHGKHVKADKKLLDELTAELKTAAGDKVAANLGTSMHSFTELADRAWHSPDGPRSIMGQVPPDCRDDVETYIRLLEETGLEPVPNLIEFTTLVKQYGVAGTSDNCYKVTKPLTLKIGRAEVRLEPGEYVIGDKKTGRDLDYGWQEIAIQLAVYAQGLNSCGRWDRQEKKWYPDPLNGAKVRTDAGIVVHLPVDKEAEKTPTVYGVDLESGWNAAVLCERVRAWRKVRMLASPVMVSEAEVFAPSRPVAQTVKSAPVAGDYDPDTGVTSRTTVRPPTLREKANAVTSKGEASAVWQEATAAGLPKAEVDELVAVMQVRLKELAEPGG